VSRGVPPMSVSMAFGRRTVLVPLLLAVALLAAAAPAAHTAPGACAAAHVSVERETIVEARNATLCLLNRVRARHGAPPLRMNPKLSHAARKHSRDMVQRRYFAHDSPEGRSAFDRMRATRYVPRDASWVLGENLGWGSGSLAEPMALVRAWMRSPGHRRNILDRRFRDIGIGIVPNAPVGGYDDGATYTTDFGRWSRH
jgi:uncharacterized protein YkwD